MGEFLRQHWAYLLAALALHVLFAGVFGLTMIQMSRNAPQPQLAIQAVVVDQSLLNRPSRQQQRERERERERAQAEQRERERAAAERRREQEETQKREAEQRAEQERQLEQKQREEADQRRQLEEQQLRERQEAEKKRAAQEAERKRVEEIKRKQQEAEAKRRAADEARSQKAAEDDLRRQLEEEEGRSQAESAGLLNQYIALIEQRIVRNWNRPPSARPGLECEVRVAQSPNGVVLSVDIGRCNGDAAVRQSIEAAVVRSSPLPPPPDRRLFERNLVLVFKPLD
jgi:colicin import membrane protein